MKTQPTILVIDDEAQIRKLMEVILTANEFVPSFAVDAKSGLQEAAMRHPDCIITDLGLPDQDGRDLVKTLREWYKGPIVILSVRDAEEEIAALLDSGADDYLIKPFRPVELIARLRAALRHYQRTQSGPVVRFGIVEVDLNSRIVKRKGEEVKLTSTEYKLLALLCQHMGKIVTHRFILEHLWGSTFAEETQYLRVYMAQLRKKLEEVPAKPQHLLTEAGVGYRLKE